MAGTPANVDRTEMLSTLDALARSGMRPKLIAFYQEMARRDPASWVPSAVFMQLRQ
jgi:hypothetical protein